MSNHDDDRRVEDFFAAHRSRVVEHQADDETWEGISLRAREARTRSRGMWFLGGAVAASAAAVATVVALGGAGPDARPALPAGPDQSAEQPADPSRTEPPTGEDTSPPGETTDPDEVTTGDGSGEQRAFTLPVPAGDLEVTLVGEPTGEESDLRIAQFDYACEAAELEWHCPGLAVSEDSGQSWQRRVDMSAAGFYSSVAARDSIWMWGPGAGAGERPGVPTPEDTLVRSEDGGRTWTEMPTRGTPIGVETFRATLVVVTSGCADGGADTCAEVVVTDVTADDATTGRRLVTLEGLPQPEVGVPGVTPAAALTATYDAVYVRYGSATYRIADGEQVATVVELPADGCEVTTAPESPDGLVSWCVDTDRLHTSSDGGATWREVPGVEGEEVLAVASNDGTHLVLATDAGVHVGSDGDWERTLDGNGEVVVLRALGREDVRYGGPYRFLRDGPEELSARWTSDDDGRTWTEQPRVVLP